MWKFIKQWRILCVLRDLTDRYEELGGANSYFENGKQFVEEDYFIIVCAALFLNKIIWMPTLLRNKLGSKFSLKGKKEKEMEKYKYMVSSFLDNSLQYNPPLVERQLIYSHSIYGMSPKNVVRTTIYANNDFTSFLDFVEIFVKRYPVIWSLILLPLIVGAFGSHYIKEFAHKLLNFFHF